MAAPPSRRAAPPGGHGLLHMRQIVLCTACDSLLRGAVRRSRSARVVQSEALSGAVLIQETAPFPWQGSGAFCFFCGTSRSTHSSLPHARLSILTVCPATRVNRRAISV